MSENQYHHPRKPLTCPNCGANVAVLRDDVCLDCYSGLVTPTDTAIEHDWSPEENPDEARDLPDND